MDKWIHERETHQRFNSSSGAPETKFSDWIYKEGEEPRQLVAMISDNQNDSEKLQFACAIAVTPEALEFAIDMAAYFANNPNGYEDLRAKCFAVLHKAFPSKEVARAS